MEIPTGIGASEPEEKLKSTDDVGIRPDMKKENATRIIDSQCRRPMVRASSGPGFLLRLFQAASISVAGKFAKLNVGRGNGVSRWNGGGHLRTRKGGRAFRRSLKSKRADCTLRVSRRPRG